MENKVQVTKKQELSLIEPSQLLKEPLPKNVMVIVDNPDAKSLAFYKKEDQHYGYKFLVLALLEVNEQFNIDNKMSDAQINSAARILDTKYFFFTPDDFRLAFIEGITGKYGKVYNRLDIGVICGWLDEYNMSRTEYAISRHSKYKENYESRTGKVNSEEVYKEVFAKNYSDLKNKAK